MRNMIKNKELIKMKQNDDDSEDKDDDDDVIMLHGWLFFPTFQILTVAPPNLLKRFPWLSYKVCKTFSKQQANQINLDAQLTVFNR